MRRDLVLIFRFCSNFGLLSGLQLFLTFKFGNVNQIRLPRIKHPLYLRPNTSDVPTFNQVFLQNEYDLHVSAPKVIIDGGANIGLFAVLMKNKYPEAKIICIEPDQENFSILQANTAAYDDIYCENCGIWNKETVLKVFDKYNGGKWQMIVEEDSQHGNVPAITLNTILEKYAIRQVDILKLDIETSEKYVFQENFKSWLPKVKTIVIELHDWLEEDCSKPFFSAINQTFSRYKYYMKGENTIIENKDLDFSRA